MQSFALTSRRAVELSHELPPAGWLDYLNELVADQLTALSERCRVVSETGGGKQPCCCC